MARTAAQAVATEEWTVEARDSSRMAHTKHTMSTDVESRRRRSIESSGEYYAHLIIIQKLKETLLSLSIH